MSESEPTKSISTEAKIAEDLAKPAANYLPPPPSPSVQPPRPNIPAWVAAFATVGMLIATVVNVSINKWQGDTMDDSLLAAQTAANAAKSAAETAVKSLQSSQKDKRPYLVTTVPHFVESLTAGQQGKANVIIQNIGRTPAIKQKTHIALLSYRVKNTDEFVAFLDGAFADLRARINRGGKYAPIARKDVAPGGTVFSTATTQSTLSADEIRSIERSDSLALIYIGILGYTDASEEAYETEFCYLFVGKNPKTWNICDYHNIIK